MSAFRIQPDLSETNADQTHADQPETHLHASSTWMEIEQRGHYSDFGRPPPPQCIFSETNTNPEGRRHRNHGRSVRGLNNPNYGENPKLKLPCCQIHNNPSPQHRRGRLRRGEWRSALWLEKGLTGGADAISWRR